MSQCLEELRNLEVQFDLVSTRKLGHATQLSREMSQDPAYEAIVVAGGDGSLNEAASGILGAEIPLGIIPCGTANVLAAEIGLSNKASVIAGTIAYGKAEKIYPGIVDDRVFLLMLGAGFDARVIDRVNFGVKRVLGQGAYFVSAVCEFFRRDPPTFDVALNDQKYRANWVIVSRSRHYAGKFLLTSKADLKRPDYAVLLFEYKSLGELGSSFN